MVPRQNMTAPYPTTACSTCCLVGHIVSNSRPKISLAGVGIRSGVTLMKAPPQPHGPNSRQISWRWKDHGTASRWKGMFHITTARTQLLRLCKNESLMPIPRVGKS